MEVPMTTSIDYWFAILIEYEDKDGDLGAVYIKKVSYYTENELSFGYRDHVAEFISIV